MKYPKPKKKSKRKILRDEIGALHLAYLIKKRGNRCQLSGKPANGLGRFHILSVGAHPRMEFLDQNIFLVNWKPLHFWWHHDFVKAKRNVEPLIIQLIGKDYRQKLLVLEKMQQRHTLFYLQTLKTWFERELND